jgi:hypothetical protein
MKAYMLCVRDAREKNNERAHGRVCAKRKEESAKGANRLAPKSEVESENVPRMR